jgi:hypothetical protein
MIFAFHNIKHYLMGKKIVFHVDHMTSMYFIDKSQILGHIAICLLMFMEYKFMVVYKSGCTHMVVDALSKLPNSINQ